MGWRQEQQRQAWANWIDAEQWDVFGTLNFASLHHLGRADRDDVCGKMWRSYFGAIDRALKRHPLWVALLQCVSMRRVITASKTGSYKRNTRVASGCNGHVMCVGATINMDACIASGS